MRVLVVNAGSSSLKLSVVVGADVTAATTVSSPGGRIDESDLHAFLEQVGAVDAVGHRIVHGGVAYDHPVRIDDDVVRRLDSLTDLAPLHQPKSLRALRTVRRLLPNVPAVAAFDTAFHAHMPEAATTYALPAEWRVRWPLRRFGFHGLSHAYAARRVADLMGADVATLRTVVCHLGAGASLCAVDGGYSVDTTMGFTPLEGLVMATRSGSVDPGLVLWLEEHVGMPPSELASTLEHRSGLLGLAGTDDLEAILAAESDGDPRAALAVSVYLHRLRAGIAAMTAALGGLDALVFTGGVGENAASVRARAADRLGFLDVRIDAEANAAPPDADITGSGSVRVWVIAAREDLEIARQVHDVLGQGVTDGS